jgi:hypothetical protein
MKRDLVVALTLAALSFFTSVTGFAQNKVKADVPFAFQVGTASLPSGTYVVSEIGDHSIMIRNTSAVNSAALSNCISAADTLRTGSPRMLFHKYGNTYFLAEIRGGSGASGMQLPETDREKELRASNLGFASDEVVIVALK